ncbi:MAG: tyrosine-type recombinase/integrase [bacterium]|nr:tyrosine-type recombinase/integrase [bacterium]
MIDESKCLTLAQVRKLRQRCKEAARKTIRFFYIRDWFMIELGLFCGLRVSEMTNLKIADLNIQDKQSSLVIRHGKGDKARIVYFSPEFKNICRLFLEQKKESGQSTGKEDWLLSNDSGNQLTTRALQKAFKRCLLKAGLETRYGIHSLRHTYGTHLYKVSAHNLRLVQQQLGHSSINTTQIYASLFNEDVREAVRKLYR